MTSIKNPLQDKQWSPYLVGLGIGVLSWFAFASVDHPLGITTAFEHGAALGVQAIAPGLAANNEYFETETPKVSWETMLVVGVFLGAFFSSLASGDRERIVVPVMWKERFGPSVPLRFTAAFFGAGLMMFGARLAQGCTSGHGISGTLQLAASSWLFAILFFGTGVATSLLLYGRRSKTHV
ncbi:YeeE/YedE thiosulfate transporter family protein [Aureliella helgolandensis]|uniref:Putative inner membrane protein n=1 Tax=Aureliella helgolandensis TaxID=2527968 RepID=A0A518GD41_9BACT|nr:YeeE/YedE thiosulfate transporter family protein [Aureliella helgolandensis]QDV26516.1 putative inner membrane protein [Aureliella helgolandensis]